MATYKTSDLVDSLSSALKDGLEYVEISELPPDEDGQSSSLFLQYIDCDDSGQEDIIDSVEVPDDYFID